MRRQLTLLLVLLISACVAQALGGAVSAEDCPKQLRRLQDQNAELVARLLNATNYIEQFTAEFNNFFNEMTATRRPAAAASRGTGRRA